MKKLCVLVLLLHLLSSGAGAAFTFTSVYNTVDAGVSSTVGFDTQHDEGGVPVGVLASAGDGTSGAAALAQADLLSVASWSALTFQPGVLGGAGSAAGSAVLGLQSTTPWFLTLAANAVVPDVPPGFADAMAAAQVQDAVGNPIYAYSFSVDGPMVEKAFAAGTYNVLLFVNSTVSTSDPLNDPLDLLSAAQLDAAVVAIPLPGAALLTALGSSGAVLLRRKLL